MCPLMLTSPGPHVCPPMLTSPGPHVFLIWQAHKAAEGVAERAAGVKSAAATALDTHAARIEVLTKPKPNP